MFSKSVFVLAAFLGVALIGSASAEPIHLQGTFTFGQVGVACINANGTSTGGIDGSYGCKTDKGTVLCTANGDCYGDCASCGQSASAPVAPKPGGGNVASSGLISKLGGTVVSPKPILSPVSTVSQKITPPAAALGSAIR